MQGFHAVLRDDEGPEYAHVFSCLFILVLVGFIIRIAMIHITIFRHLQHDGFNQ